MDKSTALVSSGQDDNRERLSLIINSIGIGIWDWQIQTGELTFNNQWAEMIGYTPDELAPIDFRTWSENLHPDDLVAAESALERCFSGEAELYEIELRLMHKSGHYVWVMATGKVVEMADDGNPKRMIGMHLDINERKKSEELQTLTSQLLTQSQQIAKVGGWELDLKTNHLFWTDETYRIHDTSPDDFNPTLDAGVDFYLPESKSTITKALDEAVKHAVGYDLELETFTTKGRKIDVRTTCVVTQEKGVAVRLAGIFQDISDQKAIQRKLEQTNFDLAAANSALKLSAHYDPLTGLPNRYLLDDRMQQAIVKSARTKKVLAIAFIDIDGFKKVNDSHGHSIGDELLKKIAGELKNTL
ncbi:MAG: PAS domain-containing protein, partial [Congregibacter sp.]|nr:PAS domain-containing protein [Congregibacter sp.]